MGHKVHPTGFRLGVIKGWQSKWYTDTHYAEFVQEDVKLRESIRSKYPEAAVSLMEIDRQAKDVTITLHTARPGIVIGRGGQRVDEMRLYLEGLIGKRVRLNIQEVRQPELDAYLVGRAVAEQIERRVAYRRAMKQAIFRTIQAGAKGIKISCAGRLGNAEIARRQTSHQGQVPLHTLRADIDYGFTEAHTTLGRIGVKVWIYKGQVLPEAKVVEAVEKPVEEISEGAEEAPVMEPEGAPVEAVAEGAEPVTEAEPEKKPAKPRAKKSAEPEAAAAPEEPAKAEAVAEPKKKPAKAEAAATLKKKPAKAEAATAPKEKPDKADAVAAPEEKPAKQAAKRTKKATTVADTGDEAAESAEDTVAEADANKAEQEDEDAAA